MELTATHPPESVIQTNHNTLTAAEVARYLIDRGLVSPCSAVEGDLLVLDASRRNTNFKVICERGSSYFIKRGTDQERASTLSNEVALYSFFQSNDACARLCSYLPLLHDYNPDEHIVVFELLPNTCDLREYHAHLGRFPVSLAAAMGRALGILHNVHLDHAALAQIELREAPWPLTLHRPSLSLYLRMSNANVQLVGALQGLPVFGMLLDALRTRWSLFANDAVVHYDVKLDNVLVTRDRRGRAAGIKLVDWELAGVGDPAWDVGALFGEYLGFWLLSIPVTGENPPEHFLEMARYPLGRVQPAIMSCWQSYKAERGHAMGESAPFLWRAVAYAACRLVQTAFESSQGSSLLTGNALAFLQLSFNILQRPFEAAIHLLGITEP